MLITQLAKGKMVLLATAFFLLAGSTPCALAFKKPGHGVLESLDKRGAADPRTNGFREKQTAGLAQLQALIPTARVQWDPIFGLPKYVHAPGGFLSGPNGEGKGISAMQARALPAGDPHRPIKAFLNEHAALFGYGAEAVQPARLQRDYVATHNGLRTVVWQQQLYGVAVYDGVLVGHITKAGELVCLSSYFLPNLDQAANRGSPNRAALLAAPSLSAEEAVVIAAEAIGEPLLLEEVIPLEAAAADAEQRQTFQAGTLPGEGRAKLVWLPLDRSTVRLCWQVELTRHQGGERFRILVDVQSHEVVLRRCLTVYLSDASYRVFTSDSPSPFSPGYALPSTNQPPLVSRRLVTWPALNTNASPIGWISGGENETRGNNVDAHLDRNADDIPDLPRPHGSPFRVFDFPLDLTQSPATYGDAAVVQLFYWCNWMHDKLYDLGFTEAAGNFQKDNFARGGLGNDALQADAQDGSDFNNANFTPTPDGEAPRVQMFVFNGPTPNRDGDLDAEIVLHEYTHGLTDRLVGGGVGISALQTGGMGEGWSDWYALTLLSEPSDDVEACYAEGGYATWLFYGLTENYYFGIRRYPYSTDLLKNPLTFKDIDPTQADSHAGIPLNPVIGGGMPDEVHNQGEVWCVTLWELRANLVRKHGFAKGNPLALQLVTDGLKLSPPNPDFLQARDAILLADQVDTGGANFDALWSAFAKRGMGFSAAAPPSVTTEGVRESFDLPDALLVTPAGELIFSGPVAGPFSPNCVPLLLTNHNADSLAWSVHAASSWLAISPATGMLAGFSATNVVVCLSEMAFTTPVTILGGAVIVSNLTSGFAQSQPAQLRIMGFAALPFIEGFESGALRDCWCLTGTGPFHTRVTPDHGPHSGAYHLTMDSAIGGYYSRNEATLGIDLTGYTNVVLRFWAKGFDEEPDAPPPSPFLYGADFDGVAVSQDGISWYEVQSLRSLKGDYTELVVDLDAALRNFNFSYNSTFRIRFNQFDNYPIPDDGIAIDDISITGTPARRFAVAVPAQATEGDGVLKGQGHVTLGLPVSADLLVRLASSDTSKATVPATVTIPAGSVSTAFDVTIIDNSLLDGTQPAIITVTAPGYVSGSATILVRDNETAVLKVNVHPKAREGDGVVRQFGTVMTSSKPARDIVVTLTSSDHTEVLVPATVTIPAGQHSVDFEITVVDELDLDGPQWVAITAHVDHWSDGSDRIEILDNDVGQISLLLPALASEGNGMLTNAGTVQLSVTVATNLTVSLSWSKTNKLVVPAVVTIPAGQFSAPFDLRVIDNTIIDGLQMVTVTAMARGFISGSATMGILDDETPPVPYLPQPPDHATNVPLSVALAWHPGIGEIVVNGGFETGDFTGWNKRNGGYGDFVIADGYLDPDGPENPMPPYAGKYCALSMQVGGGSHTLYQDIFIPPDAKSVTLSWVDRIRNYASEFIHANQEFRVEIQDTNNTTKEVIFSTQPSDPLTNDWTRRSYDISFYRGQTIRLAFVEVDSLLYLNVYIDNVSIQLGANGVTTFDVFFGTNAVPGPAQRLGTTTNAFWTLPKLALDTTYYWQVVSRRGAAQTASPVWRFMTRGVGPLDHFEWGPIPSPQFVGQPFSATILARDGIGNVATNFAGPVSLRALAGQGTASAIVISELQVGSGGRVEFANVSGRHIDISGWQIAAYDNRFWPAPRFNFIVPSNSMCRAGETFVLNRFGTAPGVYPNFYSSIPFTWNTTAVSNPIAVLFRDAASNVVDFVCAVDANPARIINPMAIPSSEWNGNPIPLNTNLALTYQRIGNLDHNDASDWIVATNSVGAFNPGMASQFQERIPLVVAPDLLFHFSSGIWTGQLTLSQAVDQVTLQASDGHGTFALSGPIAVTASNNLRLSLNDSPHFAILADNVSYTLVVTNSGPGDATGVRLTDLLPVGVAFLSATASQGGCSNAGSTVVCHLDTLPAGSSAVVAIVVQTILPGLLTNVASVTFNEPDGYPPDNSAMAITAVNPPTLAVLDATVTERDTDSTNALFRVRLSDLSSLPVSVNFATADGSAIAGADYVAVAGTLFFQPGTTSQTVIVPVLGDTLYEHTETFFVILSAPTNASLARDIATGRISDNDPLPSLSINDVAVLEGATGTQTNAIFTVRLSAPSGLTTTVNYSTADGTATAPDDYEPQVGTVTFPAGTTTQTIAIVINGDRRYESNQIFYVVLSSPVNAAVGRGRGAGTITDDDAGELDHFELSTVPSPQYAGWPFSLTITARDAVNNVATNFNGRVDLRALPRGREITIGSGTNVWEYPMGAYYHDERIQVIYLADEVGGAGAVNALSLNVAVPPGQVLTNWTLRLKHSPLTNYLQAAWESNGWTIVYQKDLTVTARGWLTFYLDTPFAYNGTDSMMVDFSFNNSSWSSDGLCGFFPTSQARSIFFQTDSAFGDPLTWSGTNAPTPRVANRAPIIRLSLGEAVTVTPTNSDNFVNGVWSGQVTVLNSATNLLLRVADADGHVGFGNDFVVELAPGASIVAGASPASWLGSEGMVSVRIEGRNVYVCFRTLVGQSYQVECTDNLAGGNWMPVADGVAGTGYIVQIVDPEGAHPPSRFYRVKKSSSQP